MKQENKEDFEDFMSSITENCHRVYKKYLEIFKPLIEQKISSCKYTLHPDEVYSDATMAINDMFLEINQKLLDGYEEVEKGISMQNIFNKHFNKDIRINKEENRPLGKVIKIKFNNSVSKSKKKDVYENYLEQIQYLNLSNCTYDASTEVSDTNYIGGQDYEHEEMMKEIFDIIDRDKGSNEYQDMYDRFVDGKTIQQIADEPRNNGVRRQTIHKRLFKYIEELKKKHKKESNGRI